MLHKPDDPNQDPSKSKLRGHRALFFVLPKKGVLFISSRDASLTNSWVSPSE